MQAAGGEFHNCVLSEDGQMRCWGLNNRSQLGDPSLGVNEVVGDMPGQMEAIEDVMMAQEVIQIDAGRVTTCALYADATLVCIGENGQNGQLGRNTTVFSIGGSPHPGDLPPIDIGGDVVQFAMFHEHTCAVLDGGTVRCFGRNTNGQLGTGDTQPVGDNEHPGDVPAIDFGTPVVEVGVGFDHTCALTQDGSVRCWGDNEFGQLGVGNQDDQLDATQAQAVDLGGVATDLVVGGNTACATLESGDVRCWGDGAFGALASGSTDVIGDDELPSEHPSVVWPEGEVVDRLTDGARCARFESGNVVCWGVGFAGLNGQGSLENLGDDETLALVPPIQF